MNTTTETDESTETSAVEVDDSTDDATTTEAVDETDESTEETEDDGKDDSGAHKARQEAKNLRERLRATEGERDTLTAQVDALRTAEITRLAGLRLANGADLLDIGETSTSELLADDGSVDSELVDTAIEVLLESRSYLGKRRFAGTADGGTRTSQPPAKPAPTWQQAIGGKE